MSIILYLLPNSLLELLSVKLKMLTYHLTITTYSNNQIKQMIDLLRKH